MNAIILAFWLYFANLSAYGLVAPRNDGNLASTNSLNGRAETKAEYLVTPVDAQDPDLMHDLAQYLREVTGQSDIYNYTNSDDHFHWWIVDLTDRQRDKVEEHRDVEFIGSNESVDDEEDISLAYSKRHQPGNWTEGAPRTDTHEKRLYGENYDYQSNAPDDLLDLSRKRLYEQGKHTSYYVFPEEAGEGTFLYHIEHGLLPGYDEEFPSERVDKPLKTKRYRDLERTNKHQPPTTHSTCTASKAMGTTYGAAKKATLVPILRGDMKLTTQVEAFNLAAKDIKEKGRKRKSVVVLSASSKKTLDEVERNACNDPMLVALQKSLEDLLLMGVPVVVTAGNKAKELDPVTNQPRKNVDTVTASLGLPIFVIGAADENGQAADFSQKGSMITGWARGTNIRCAGEDGPKSGTSFAAPVWAGALITFMGRRSGTLYEDYTQGKKGMEFIEEVEDFVKMHATWVRVKGVKMFWNLAAAGDFPN